MVNSSCTTSLETLLYRQTSKASSKFFGVAGKSGCFGLRGMGSDLEKLTVVLPSERPSVAGVALHESSASRGNGSIRNHSSDSSGSYNSEEEDDDEEEDESSSDMDGEEGEIEYCKRYNFLLKMAKP